MATFLFRSLAVLFYVLLAGGLTADSRPFPVTGHYAFATQDALVVMNGTTEVARAGIDYSYRLGGIVWTWDGRYVAILSDGGAGTDAAMRRELVTVDAATGRTERFRCPLCGSVAPVGTGSVLVARNNHDVRYLEGLLRFDLPDRRPPVNLTVPDMWQYQNVRLVGGNADEAHMVGMNEGGDAIFSVSPEGDVDRITTSVDLPPSHDVGGLAQNDLGRAVVEGSPAYGDDRGVYLAIASVLKPDPGDCPDSYAVFLVDVITGTVAKTDRSAVEPVDIRPGIDGYVRVLDLWWGRNGRLHAVMLSGPCGDDVEPDRGLVPPSVWTLVQGHWEKADGDDGTLAERAVGSTAVVTVLRPHGVFGLTGDLYHRDGAGNRERVGTEVFEVQVPHIPRCGDQGERYMCGGVEIQEGEEHDAPEPRPSRAPGFVPPTPSGDEPACDEEVFFAYVEYSYTTPESMEAHCREGYAYVRATGAGLSLEDRKDLLFRATSDGWSMITGGTNDDGTFSVAAIEDMGLDADVLLGLFPEMEVSEKQG